MWDEAKSKPFAQHIQGNNSCTRIWNNGWCNNEQIKMSRLFMECKIHQLRYGMDLYIRWSMNCLRSQRKSASATLFQHHRFLLCGSMAVLDNNRYVNYMRWRAPLNSGRKEVLSWILLRISNISLYSDSNIPCNHTYCYTLGHRCPIRFHRPNGFFE